MDYVAFVRLLHSEENLWLRPNQSYKVAPRACTECYFSVVDTKVTRLKIRQIKYFVFHPLPHDRAPAGCNFGRVLATMSLQKLTRWFTAPSQPAGALASRIALYANGILVDV